MSMKSDEAIQDLQFLARRYDELMEVYMSVHRESLDMAIKALMENQRYHEIGTVEEFKALKENERKCEDCGGCTAWKCDCANVRANAIDEFVNAVKEKFPDDRNGIANIERIAEQMKEGRESD